MIGKGFREWFEALSYGQRGLGEMRPCRAAPCKKTMLGLPCEKGAWGITPQNKCGAKPNYLLYLRKKLGKLEKFA